LALVIMSLIGRRHMDGESPWSTDALARELRMPMRAIDEVLQPLKTRGILTTTGDEPPGWLPLRDLQQVTTKELLDTVRAAGEDQHMSPDLMPETASIRQLLHRLDEAKASVLQNVTVKDLIKDMPERYGRTEP